MLISSIVLIFNPHRPRSMGVLPDVSNIRLNVVISAWICIALGSGLLLSDGSMFAMSISAPLSIGGVILLIIGLSMDNEDAKSEFTHESWTPSASFMPDAGRPMFRIDTTLDEPIRTSILCGRCANLVWVDGKSRANSPAHHAVLNYGSQRKNECGETQVLGNRQVSITPGMAGEE